MTTTRKSKKDDSKKACAYLYGHVSIEDGVVKLKKFSISDKDLGHTTTDVRVVCIRQTYGKSFPDAFHRVREHALLMAEYSRYWEIISEQLQKLPVPNAKP